ncbi:CRE-SRT-52 protein, partial [Aphelenchoides avenae]
VAYIPCVFVFWRHMRHSSCYKIMFFLGVVDIVNMGFVGGFTAICAIWGLVYCSAPAIMYFVGTVAPLFWYLEASTALLLAINRCVDICAPNFADLIGRGNRTWALLAIPTAYSLTMVMFAKACPFSGINVACSFNPHIG